MGSRPKPDPIRLAIQNYLDNYIKAHQLGPTVRVGIFSPCPYMVNQEYTPQHYTIHVYDTDRTNLPIGGLQAKYGFKAYCTIWLQIDDTLALATGTDVTDHLSRHMGAWERLTDCEWRTLKATLRVNINEPDFLQRLAAYATLCIRSRLTTLRTGIKVGPGSRPRKKTRTKTTCPKP